MVCALVYILIVRLQTSLEKALNGNKKLLDGMHEGLLIIAESSLGPFETPRVMFSNNPARKLIKLFYDADRRNADYKVDCLQKKVFSPAKLFSEGTAPPESRHDGADRISLEQIIVAQKDEPV